MQSRLSLRIPAQFICQNTTYFSLFQIQLMVDQSPKSTRYLSMEYICSQLLQPGSRVKLETNFTWTKIYPREFLELQQHLMEELSKTIYIV